MHGEPWKTPPRQEEKLQIQDRECIALKPLTQCGGQKGSMTCCKHAGPNPWDLKARTQDIEDKEVVQTGIQRKFERLSVKNTTQFEQGTMQSSNCKQHTSYVSFSHAVNTHSLLHITLHGSRKCWLASSHPHSHPCRASECCLFSPHCTINHKMDQGF